MNKQTLREELKKCREQLPSTRRKEASQKACDLLYKKTEKHPFILSFASKASEIDLWPLNNKLAKEGRLLLPRLIHHQIVPFHVTSIEKLIKSEWGVMEPDAETEKAAKHSDIACVLVPGLGFDARLHRVGYGLGHFDRFLSKMPSADTIGVGFTEQKVETPLPIESHDKALKEVLFF